MATTAKIDVKDRNPVSSLRDFLAALLNNGEMDALLVAQRLPIRNVVMPTLVTDPAKLAGADPLAPVFPINAAKIVSKLTRKPFGGRVAVVLRPCEIRAFIELVKLKQGRVDDVLLIGFDCYGAYSNINYTRFGAAGGSGADSTVQFYRNIREGRGTVFEDFDLSPACKACEHFVPDNADLLIGLAGADLDESMWIKANTPSGDEVLSKLKLPAAPEPEARKRAVADLLAQRRAYRDQMFVDTGEATSDLEKLMNYLGNCVNCYNCRVACPVCYCKECVFVTDVFDHEPSQFIRWAKKKGVLKMPTDTVFYHLTRLAHMSTACIGCGQCSNACPNNVPVMELFRTIAHHTQRAFSYTAGRGLEDEPPLSTFREKEFSEVTGGKD
jgi:formate dehydrogenase (coenzyme F420) beta subunit